MGHRVVITGLGVVAPGADNTPQFWNNLKQGVSAIEPLSKCECRKPLKVKYGGQVLGLEPRRYFKKRTIKKCDDFSIYSLLAVHEALEDAKLDLETIDRDRIGIYVGNNSGGWNAAETGLKDLHQKGTRFVSPYLASNWFPAAAQGHLSIHFNLRGYSKTIAADMASSNVAIGNAYRILRNGKADYMVAGGAENLMVGWGLLFYQTTTMLSLESTSQPQSLYQPFGRFRSGLVLGEGAAYVIMETLESARQRNVSIYAEVVGSGLSSDGHHYRDGDESGDQYARAVGQALTYQYNGGDRAHHLDEHPIDYISLNGTAVQREDNAEVNGLKRIFGDRLAGISCSCPKAFYGHAFGAAGGMDVITACLSMKHNTIIKTGNVEACADGVALDLVTGNNLHRDVNSSLVINKGLGGINSALYFKSL
jgi:3-oxoacyl-[acyl-carrier-protein] synthase II